MPRTASTIVALAVAGFILPACAFDSPARAAWAAPRPLVVPSAPVDQPPVDQPAYDVAAEALDDAVPTAYDPLAPSEPVAPSALDPAAAPADAAAPLAPADPAQAAPALFSAEQLQQIVGPIALYPDPLLAQVLAGSTYPLEIVQAARFLKANEDDPAVLDKLDAQPFDASVKALARYPHVLNMMNENLQWTQDLGGAFLDQQADVMAAIQACRAQAQSAGNLATSKEQVVVVEEKIIQIVPADPEIIYVPQYVPEIVYVERPIYSPFVTFSVGYHVGSWLHLDCDWHHHHVFHGGWYHRHHHHLHDHHHKKDVHIHVRRDIRDDDHHRSDKHDHDRDRSVWRRDVTKPFPQVRTSIGSRRRTGLAGARSGDRLGDRSRTDDRNWARPQQRLADPQPRDANGDSARRHTFRSDRGNVRSVPGFSRGTQGDQRQPQVRPTGPSDPIRPRSIDAKPDPRADARPDATPDVASRPGATDERANVRRSIDAAPSRPVRPRAATPAIKPVAPVAPAPATSEGRENREPRATRSADKAVDSPAAPSRPQRRIAPVTPITPKSNPAKPRRTPQIPPARVTPVTPVTPDASDRPARSNDSPAPRTAPARTPRAPAAAPSITKPAAPDRSRTSDRPTTTRSSNDRVTPATPKATPRIAPITRRIRPITPRTTPTTPRIAPITPRATPTIPRRAETVRTSPGAAAQRERSAVRPAPTPRQSPRAPVAKPSRAVEKRAPAPSRTPTARPAPSRSSPARRTESSSRSQSNLRSESRSERPSRSEKPSRSRRR